MRLRPAFRLLRVGPDWEPQTLFHGFHGSRTLAQDKMLRAVEKRVTNPGNSTGLDYVSGWHVLPSWKECDEYLERFTADSDIVISRVWVACSRPKPRARGNIMLARYMKIKSLDWGEAKQTTRA